jgi:hypothetical protein
MEAAGAQQGDAGEPPGPIPPADDCPDDDSGRPKRPATKLFRKLPGSSGSKPPRECMRCPEGARCVIKSAVPSQMFRHLMVDCTGMDETAKVQLQTAEDAYTEEYPTNAAKPPKQQAAASQGSTRQRADSSSTPGPAAKRANTSGSGGTQMTLGNYGIAGAKRSTAPEHVANKSSIWRQLMLWIAVASLPMMLVSSPQFQTFVYLCNPNIKLPSNWQPGGREGCCC